MKKLIFLLLIFSATEIHAQTFVYGRRVLASPDTTEFVRSGGSLGTPAGGQSPETQQVTDTFTSAQYNGSTVTPLSIVAAKPDSIIIPTGAVLILQFVDTDWTNNGVKYGLTNAPTGYGDFGLSFNTSGASDSAFSLAYGTYSPSVSPVNNGLVLSANAGCTGGGSGKAIVVTYYQVLAYRR